MSITPEFHVGITAPGADGIYAVFSTRERAQEFIRTTLAANDSHDYKAVITDQSYVENKDDDAAVDDHYYGIALDHRYDDAPDED